ncbi:alanine racemase [Patescibacteria group bacterium]|nr:alanine racemase [Patescibacteria group bacterium]MBU1500801.1 alanine racemase [Patescibacteria group bacterium]MBU2080856.1 alanine racemase [Patescibacteria group bacterium]MBU2123961.1 alanine racemase [Patescibacteria group bacterium]MBU2194748.1 alanine racemase [Patescibacteria group bacterium]
MDIQRHLKRALRRVYARRHAQVPLITISISKDRLLHNLRTYRKEYPELAIAPMLKSNAYGHGLCVVGRLLDSEDISFFAVDSLYEARKLREGGVRSPIVVMGYVRPEDIVRNKLRHVSFAITDLEQLRTVSRTAKKPTVLHIKFDTGMHRNGILEQDIEECIELLQANTSLQVDGVCSHLADADNIDAGFSIAQLGVWERCVSRMHSAYPSLEYTHISATKGARFATGAPMNTVRIGMGLFGYDTSPKSTLPLLPVLSMQTLVTSLRTIQKGESVGYGATFVADSKRVVATIPVGYAEGLDRELSNRGQVSVTDTLCPLAGRVSMNMASVDVTDCKNVARGDRVTVISSNREDPNSIQGMAKTIGTTPYVLFAHLPEHIMRVVA